MKKIFVKHHLGMGDCIVHNGMVRKISEENPNHQIWVGTKKEYEDNIKFMYKDNPKIHVFGCLDDNDMNFHIYNTEYEKIISTHADRGHGYSYDKYFDDSFYMSIGMDPKIKKDYFYLERDYNKENLVYEELINNNNIDSYYFIHEKPEYNVLIDRNKLKKKLPIISADRNYNIFDLLTVIEKADECHIISSSFLSFFMCKKYNKKTFAHMYCDRQHISPYVKKNKIKVIL